MMLTMKVMMVIFGSMICSEGLVQPKLFKIFPKSMQVSMNPPITKLELPIREKMRSFNQFFVIESDRETEKEKCKIETKTEPEVSKRHFFNFETRLKISPIQYGTSRRIFDFRSISFNLLSSISDFVTRTRIEINTITQGFLRM